MDMIKRLAFVLAAAVCAASCLDNGGSYTNSYVLDTTFEYDSSVFQRDSLAFDTQVGLGLGWQEMAFYHRLSEDKKEFLGGFILSRLKGSGDSELNRFRVNSGTGYRGSASYLVYYENPDPAKMPKREIEFIASNVGTCTMAGCFVNNTKETVDFVNTRFVDGDRLSVKMTGYLYGKETGSSEFVLAEFTEQKDSVVTSWSPFELDKLGDVDSIDVRILTNRNDVPKAFCLEDVMAKILVSY